MDSDIIIIGAGPAGLSFAREMGNTNYNIIIVEKQNINSIKEPSYDGREIALTHLSHRIMQDLGIWDLIPKDDIALIKKAKVLNGNSSYALSFDHKEVGKENLGFLISNHLIRKAMFNSIKEFSNIKIIDEEQLYKIGTNDKNGYIELKSGKQLKAPLIIAADSRFSISRRMMGIPTSMLDFGRTCIVCTMEHELAHDNTAYECFHYDRTVAVLPMNKGKVSVVITLKSEESQNLLNMDKQEFANDVAKRINYKFGNLKLHSDLYPYPLVASMAKTFCKNRFALIGDAAVGMHPVTAHGFNLGLSGAHILAKEIKKNGINSQISLETYSRKHKRHAAPIYHGTNAIVKLYTQNYKTAKIARKALLRLGNHIKPAKRIIMNQLTEVKEA